MVYQNRSYRTSNSAITVLYYLIITSSFSTLKHHKTTTLHFSDCSNSIFWELLQVKLGPNGYR